LRDVSARLDITDIPHDTKVCIGMEKWITYDVVRVGGPVCLPPTDDEDSPNRVGDAPFDRGLHRLHATTCS
jgi:hypothetical protein